MEPLLVKSLRSRCAAIQMRWETLLRIERVNGPLANPDALVHLIPDSVAHVFELLRARVRTPLSLVATAAERLPACNCG